MKMSAPIYLLPYIDFEDGKVVPAKPIPKIYQKSFHRYCKRIEQAEQRRQENMSLQKDSNKK